jgi:hypothetical protein
MDSGVRFQHDRLSKIRNMSKKTGRKAVATGFTLATRSRKTMELMVEVALEQFPTTCSGSDLGVGRKVFFFDTVKDEGC